MILRDYRPQSFHLSFHFGKKTRKLEFIEKFPTAVGISSNLGRHSRRPKIFWYGRRHSAFSPTLSIHHRKIIPYLGHYNPRLLYFLTLFQCGIKSGLIKFSCFTLSYGLVGLKWNVLGFSWNRLWVEGQGHSSNGQIHTSLFVIQLSNQAV